MFCEVVVALGGTPGNCAESTTLLIERHFEMPLLQLSRTIDDLDPTCREDRTRVSGAKWGKCRDFGGHAAANAPKSEIGVDAQSRHQVVGSECFVGHIVEGDPKG